MVASAWTDAPLPSGSVLFARYAFPPNELGYCGPADADRLLAHGGGLEVAADIAERARAFDGAFAYLQLIADAAGIDDPLDEHVVEAYWIGNALLDRVPAPMFENFVRTSFADQTGADWPCFDFDGRRTPVAHHSFHVFTVYPWVRLLPVGGATALNVLDRCRIRWGQVTDIEGDTARVRCRPLCWDGRQLGVGPARIESVRWARSGRSLAPRPEAGDWVSLHWDWICDRITVPQVRVLRRYQQRQVKITNRSLIG